MNTTPTTTTAERFAELHTLVFKRPFTEPEATEYAALLHDQEYVTSTTVRWADGSTARRVSAWVTT